MKCEADCCDKQPSFGFLGERPRRCKAHMLEGMVRLLAQRHMMSDVQWLISNVDIPGGCSQV